MCGYSTSRSFEPARGVGWMEFWGGVWATAFGFWEGPWGLQDMPGIYGTYRTVG